MILTVLKKSEPRLVYMVLISTFSLLLLSGWLYLLKKPVKEYLQLKQNRSLLQNRVEPDFLVEEKLENMKKSIERLKQKIEGENPFLPINELVALTIDKLDTISSGHDVELTAIRPEKSRKASLFEEVPFRIEVVGDYFSLYDWMVEVEEKLGPMVVKKFAIVEDYKTKKLLMKMSIVSYRLEQEEM